MTEGPLPGGPPRPRLSTLFSPEEGETVGHGPLPHLPALDGLRGVAVLLVVLYHFLPREGAGGLFRLASLGWTGVDVFFVLSGFLITTILFRQRKQHHALARFYLRRVLRLFPLFYFVAAMLLLATPLLHLHWQWVQLGFLFYAANYVMAWRPQASFIGPFTLMHLWSLAVEEQFYLVWPFLVVAGLTRTGLLRICAVVIVAGPFLRVALLQMHVSTHFLYLSLPTRMDTLLTGAALALIPLPSRRTAHWMGGVAVLIVACCALRSRSLYSETVPMATIGFSAIALTAASILVLGLHPGTYVSRLLLLRPLRFYGRYSYGLYVWHLLLGRWFLELSGVWARAIASRTLAGLLSTTVILAISTLLALASYWAIERPFLKLKDRFEGPRII